jgi:hypothetical protein
MLLSMLLMMNRLDNFLFFGNYIAQAGLKFTILLPQPINYRYVPP